MTRREAHLRRRGFLASFTKGRRRRKTRIKSIWDCIRARCCYESHGHYPNYGGRGIELRFESFEDFRAWACAELRKYRLGPRSEFSVDRRDTDGHYEPDNCRLWPVDDNRGQTYFQPPC